MTARPRGTFMAFGEDKTSWASDRFRGPYILCLKVPGFRHGYCLLPPALIRTRVAASEARAATRRPSW